MIALDTNLLVYAHREDSPFHDAAFACVAQCAEARSACRYIGLPVVNPLLAR